MTAPMARARAKYSTAFDLADTPWKVLNVFRLLCKQDDSLNRKIRVSDDETPTLAPAKTVSVIGAPTAAPKLTSTIPEKMPTMQNTRTLSLADRTKFLMSENPKLTYEAAFTRALEHVNITGGEPQPEVRVNMSEPVSEGTRVGGLVPGNSGGPGATRPTVISDKLRAEYNALQKMLRDADVRNAQETAAERVKPTVPQRTSAYRAAIALIARSPQMSRAEADALAKEGQAIDAASAQAQATATLAPVTTTYKELLVRG